MAQKERRTNEVPIRENLEGLLNRHQLRALRHIESSGWQLCFVRTSLFHAPVVVVLNSAGDIFATLEHDGELNLTPDLSLRKDDPPTRNMYSI